MHSILLQQVAMVCAAKQLEENGTASRASPRASPGGHDTKVSTALLQ